MSLAHFDIHKQLDVVIFSIFHIALLSYFFSASVELLDTALAWFVLQIAIHGGYHRYFSHRSFQAPPWFELLLCVTGSLAVQRGPIWWASKHRRHHQHTDTEQDHHSPVLKSFLYSHIGWFLKDDIAEIEWNYVPDLCRPIPLWVEANWRWMVGIYALGILLIGGWNGILNWWILPVVLCWHTTSLTNSICHTIGTNPNRCHPRDSCNAKNNAIVAIFNLGEGWHNNHHANPSYCNHGFYRWYQVDIVYIVLRILEAIRVLSNLRKF